jgi:hypothetical protein
MDTLAKVSDAARAAGLTPLVRRVALMLADAAGEERAVAFIRSCQEEDERKALLRLREEIQTVKAHALRKKDLGA